MPKKEQKEEKISMFDPVVGAYREIPVSRARLLIAEAKRLEVVLAQKKDE
jgi:hypothetical protein